MTEPPVAVAENTPMKRTLVYPIKVLVLVLRPDSTPGSPPSPGGGDESSRNQRRCLLSLPPPSSDAGAKEAAGGGDDAPGHRSVRHRLGSTSAKGGHVASVESGGVFIASTGSQEMHARVHGSLKGLDVLVSQCLDYAEENEADLRACDLSLNDASLAEPSLLAATEAAASPVEPSLLAATVPAASQAAVEPLLL